MCIPCADLKNTGLDIFGYYGHPLKFAVVFRVNDGKYQNILPPLIFANSPRWF